MNLIQKRFLLAAYILELSGVALHLFVNKKTFQSNEILGYIYAGCFLIGIIIPHIMRFKADSEKIYHHAVYATRSFWAYFLGMSLLLLLGIGFILLSIANDSGFMFYTTLFSIVMMSALAIWYIYRLIKGFVLLIRDQDINFKSWK